MIDRLDIDISPFDFEKDPIDSTTENTAWGNLSREDQEKILQREKEIDDRVFSLYEKCVKKYYPKGNYNRLEMYKYCNVATHSVVFGERGPGKTTDEFVYDCCYYYVSKRTIAYIVRHEREARPSAIESLFETFNELPYIKYIFKKDGWEGLELLPAKAKRRKGFYFYKDIETKTEDGEIETERIYDTKPFMRIFVLVHSSEYKGKGYPDIGRIYFDEFMPENKMYLPNEFSKFNSIMSSIRRRRIWVRCAMSSNTLDIDCPYFYELQIPEALEIPKGRIALKTFTNVEPYLHSIVYERTDAPSNNVDEFFHYENNNNAKMLIEGDWDVAQYPHLPTEAEYDKDEVIFKYFIIYRQKGYVCEVVSKDTGTFTFIHRKKTPETRDDDLVFDLESNSERPNIRRRITNDSDSIGRKVWWYFANDKVFYQDNTIGDTIAAYIKNCKGE